ncbi:MAG: hypothetical protein FJ098_08560 [Deltaproteobacteria bacterium]|nr:hypothetical protein [Deltaproteobacteria bacterium]
MRRAPGLLLLSLLALQACSGPTLQEQVKALEAENAQKRARIKTLKGAAARLGEYADALESGALGNGTYILLDPEDILAAGKQAFLKYDLPAGKVNPQIQGTFTVTDLRAVSTLPGGKLRFELLIKGRNVKVKASIPASHKKKFTEGVQAGIVAEVVVSLEVSREGAVIAKPRATDVKLLKHNDSLYTDNIKGALNKKYKQDRHVIPVKAGAGRKAVAVFTTRHHVVIAVR